MDADMTRASSETQMEMLMMQLDKLQEFSESYNTTIESPEIQFPGEIATAIQTSPPALFQNPNLTSPNNTFQILGNPIHQEPNSITPKFTTEIPEMSFQKERDSMEAMREMIFRMAVMQPIQIDPETVKLPKRRNVKISKDPQSVAARHRRERISEKIRILQRLVPGGTKMDTASMLDEAAHYVKFLKKQVKSLERAGANRSFDFGFSATMANLNYSLVGKAFQSAQMVGVGAMQMLR